MSRIHHRRAGIVALLFVFTLVATPEGKTQTIVKTQSRTVAEWAVIKANSATYGPILTELESLAVSLKSASLPDSLLVARLEEGAKKRVAPMALLHALKSDTARFLAIASTLRVRGVFPPRPEDIVSIVEQTDILLRAGIGFQEYASALDAAIRKQGKNLTAVSRGIAALAVAARAMATFRLSEKDRTRLAVELVSGDTEIGEFDSILGRMAECIASGLSTAESLDSAFGTMNGKGKGKGSSEMETGGGSQNGNRGNEGRESPGQGRQRGN